MEFTTKCMFLARDVGKTKDGNEYKRLKFLDKTSNDTIVCYVDDFGKFADMKSYTDCDVKLNLYKDSKGLYRLAMVAD